MTFFWTQPCLALIFGALTEGESLPDVPDMPSYGYLLLQTVLALILVCALAYVFLRYGLKWLLPKQKGRLDAMKVIDRLPLDGRRMIYLVEIGKKVFIIAATDTSVSKVGELDGEEASEIIRHKEGEKMRAEASGTKNLFRDVLDRVRDRRSGTRRNEKPADPPDTHDIDEEPIKKDKGEKQ